MRVTALVENNRLEDREDLEPEFGLSMLVELGESKVLFDMGATSVYASNAARLDIDISEIDVAVVSHHHFDHGGGLEHFLENNQKATVYLREAPRAQRWFKAFAVLKRPIGLDLGVLERFEDRLEFVDERREIAPGAFLLTAIESRHFKPRGNRRLFIEHDGGFKRDPFDHELMMVVHEDDGMVVFTGCSHSGVLNMIETAQKQFSGTPIKAVIGGFHLIGLPFYNSMAASRSEVRAIGREILERIDGHVYTGHCTGEKAYRVLDGVMGERLKPFRTGTSVEL
jgi:7,8-dihydropterin-6-yl-methyl-4-(beta-D-ribofuranosyl)aminobenzene 5'-phosphate synthase